MVENNASSKMNGGLIFRGEIPFIYRLIEKMPSHALLEKETQTNLHLFSYYLVTENAGYIEGHGGKASDPLLLQLDAKVNLLLDLLSHIYTQQTLLPELVSVALSDRGIRWVISASEKERAAIRVEKDQLMELSLYIQSDLPLALKLYAKITAVIETTRGVEVISTFECMNPSVQEELNRLIFRYHRRSIAHRRDL